MKRFISVLCIITVLFTFNACNNAVNTNTSSNKLMIVASLFPQYDFARQIGGDKVEVAMLLPPGVESHTFDPTPGDMLKIYNADIFIYTGKQMEPWADKVLDGVKNDNLSVVDASFGIDFLKIPHESEHEHNNESEGDHEHDSEHEHEYDPHIWLDPSIAIKMVDNILNRMCEKDPANAELYRQNASNYKEKLNALDKDFSGYIANSNKKTLVFGGRFAYLYFLKHYGLKYETAFDSCSTNAEPSVQKMAEIIKFIKENNIKYIYHEELSNPKVANSIASQTGGQCLLFSTAHNVTKSEFDMGITFLDIMNKNIENIKKGLD